MQLENCSCVWGGSGLSKSVGVEGVCRAETEEGWLGLALREGYEAMLESCSCVWGWGRGRGRVVRVRA